jgi:hypothetical protein
VCFMISNTFCRKRPLMDDFDSEGGGCRRTEISLFNGFNEF